jgi:CBS domain-containing protein
MLVRDLMTQPVRTIEASSSAEAAAKAMAQWNVGALPVCEGTRIVGILTDRDLVVQCMAMGRTPTTVGVREIMSPNPVTVAPSDSIGHAARAIGRHGFRRLPVVDHGQPVGIISADDIARFSADDEAVADMLRRLASYMAPPIITPRTA